MVPDNQPSPLCSFSTNKLVKVAGGITVRALRLTYVGELGFELHVPVEHLTTVYDALFAVGGGDPEHPLALRDAGYRALDEMSLEKSYK